MANLTCSVRSHLTRKLNVLILAVSPQPCSLSRAQSRAGGELDQFLVSKEGVSYTLALAKYVLSTNLGN
jgi:hypothetical protein